MEQTEFVTCFTEVCSAISYNHLLYYYYYFNWFVQNKKTKSGTNYYMAFYFQSPYVNCSIPFRDVQTQF